MYTVYVIKGISGHVYIGQTNNLEKRLHQHNSGYGKYTQNKGPFTVIYFEQYNTRVEAMRRERELKTGKGREWLGEITK
ncbi:MAG: GIY-YIG nuclease family protein [Patescibacteria group bacterium]